MVKLNAITIGTIIALLSYSCVNCTAKAQGWDLIIPPLRQKAILSEEFTQYRSHHYGISPLQWNQQGTRGLPKDLRICRTCFQRKGRCAATNSWIFVKVTSLTKSQLFVIWRSCFRKASALPARRPPLRVPPEFPARLRRSDAPQQSMASLHAESSR